MNCTCHMRNAWLIRACSCYSSDYMDGELNGNKVRNSNTSSGVREKAQGRAGRASRKPCLLDSLPPALTPSFFLLFARGVWIGNERVKADWVAFGWSQGRVRPLALGRTKDPSNPKTMREHPQVKQWKPNAKITCQGWDRTGIRRLDAATRDYSWEVGSGWEQGGNHQKGPKELPRTGLGGWVDMLAGPKGSETGRIQ